MKKIHLQLFILLFFFGQCLFCQRSNIFYGKDEVVEDLDELYKLLIDAHIDIYAYVDKEDFRMRYENVKGSIFKDSVSLLDATNIFQKLASAVNNGHTEIDFPGQSYREYAYNGGTLFPLEIVFENDRSLVRKNWSKNDEINVGDEVLGINGKPISEILSKIYPLVSAERQYLKRTKIEMYSFPRLYWQVFGQQDKFEVKIKAGNSIKKYHIESVDVIEGFEMKRKEIIKSQKRLRFFDNSAYIRPGSLSGDIGGYRRFIDSAFAEIKRKESKRLIVDLRNNAGGDNSFSDYLVSYFADRPFKWNSKFILRTSRYLKNLIRQSSDTNSRYNKEILAHKNGETYAYHFKKYEPQIEEKRFGGNVFVLVNRQSHSQAAVTAAQIQDYGFGTIVGEETGDYPSLYASQFQYLLPNTKIAVKISKGQIIRVNRSAENRGVKPDIHIKDYLLDEDDEILDGLLEFWK